MQCGQVNDELLRVLSLCEKKMKGEAVGDLLVRTHTSALFRGRCAHACVHA